MILVCNMICRVGFPNAAWVVKFLEGVGDRINPKTAAVIIFILKIGLDISVWSIHAVVWSVRMGCSGSVTASRGPETRHWRQGQLVVDGSDLIPDPAPRRQLH